MATGRYKGLIESEKYWTERQLELVEKQIAGLTKATQKEVQKAYLEALADIEARVSLMYAAYETENGLSHSEAQKLIEGFELQKHEARIASLIAQVQATNSPYAKAELDKIQQQVALTREQGLMAEVLLITALLAANEESLISGMLSEVYQEAYYSAMFEVGKAVGIVGSFTKIDVKSVETAISYPWSGDMFSQRIWDNRDLLVKALRQTITQGLIQGKSNQKMARELNSVMNNKYSNALRIIRTETTHVVSEATYQAYQKSEVIQSYMYIATLDKRTSGLCGSLDNKVFKLSDKKVGVNFPPMHPNCRSTIIPYFEDLDTERIAGDKGDRSYIDANTSYTEWRSQFQ